MDMFDIFTDKVTQEGVITVSKVRQLGTYLWICSTNVKARYTRIIRRKHKISSKRVNSDHFILSRERNVGGKTVSIVSNVKSFLVPMFEWS